MQQYHLQIALGISLLFLISVLVFSLFRLYRDVGTLTIQLTQSEAELNELRGEFNKIEAKYQPIMNVEAAVQQSEAALRQLNADIDKFRAEYISKRRVYDDLTREVHALSDTLELAELGVYPSTLALGTSAEYASALAQIKLRQAQMVSEKRAVLCDVKWTIDGSAVEGRRLSDRAMRLALRAFNNECEVVISKVSWKNYAAQVERIQKSREAINNLSATHRVALAHEYVALRLKELELTFGERARKQQELEALREERARLREEERAQREIEAELRRTEKEEALQREAIARAMIEAERASGDERLRLNARIADLQARLTEAEAERQRALSMAQQTRVGHVYIISNIGAFGEQVFKVGMTRRLNPMERVMELGDASVPFPFDVHALVFTQDAPGLERQLQNALDQHRVNRVNLRKEFFKIQPSQLKNLLAQHCPNVPFTDQPDAQQYFLSLPKEKLEAVAHRDEEARFPTKI